MPDTDSGHTYAGSANWSDTATVVSDPTTAIARPRVTSSTANTNPSAKSQADDEPRFATAEDRRPTNGGLTPGTYLDKRTNSIFTVGYPPPAPPAHLRAPTIDTPFVRLYGFQEFTPFANPGSNLHSGSGSASGSQHDSSLQHRSGLQQGSGSQRGSGSGSRAAPEQRQFPVRSSLTSTSPSNPRPRSQQSSRRA